jgi:hypothetical protein
MKIIKFLIVVVGVLLCGSLAHGCGLNEYGDTCECYPGFQRIQAGVCCPPNEKYDAASSSCDCLPTFSRDPTTQECVCPLNQVANDPAVGCVCIQGYTADSQGNCCPAKEFFDGTQCSCIIPLARDVNTGDCMCPDLNEQYTNGQCECIPGFTRVDGLCCGHNERNVNGVCECMPGFSVDPSSDSCVCEINQEVSADGSCVCVSEYFRANGSLLCCHIFEHEVNGACECLPGLLRNNVSLECLCPTNEVFRGVACDCVRSFVR